MKSKYTIQTTSAFIRDVKRFSKETKIKNLIENCLNKLHVNPFDTSLKTHQVNISSLGKVWSSRVTGDLRLLWELDSNDNLVIVALRLQGHDTVYN